MAQSGKIFGALLAGTVIGGVLGTLLYSRSKVLRQNIVKRAEGLTESLTDKIESGKALLTDLQKMTEAARNSVKRAMTAK